jgi:hypothetical protein
MQTPRHVEDWLKELDERWNAMTPEEQETQRAKNHAINEEVKRKYAGKSYNQIMGEELGGIVGRPDWLYHDLPRMSQEQIDEFINRVGEDNIFWLTFADYGNGQMRGQCLISPEFIYGNKIFGPEW